jgi:hypothetical protein
LSTRTATGHDISDEGMRPSITRSAVPSSASHTTLHSDTRPTAASVKEVGNGSDTDSDKGSDSDDENSINNHLLSPA